MKSHKKTLLYRHEAKLLFAKNLVAREKKSIEFYELG
jgi:hypothetical protein